MVEMMKEVIVWIVQLLALFWLVISGYIVAGMYNNIGQWKESFSWKKLLNGAAKAFAVSYGFIILGIVLSVLPLMAKNMGLEIYTKSGESINDIISIGLVYISLFAAILNYSRKLLDKLNLITHTTPEVINNLTTEPLDTPEQTEITVDLNK